MLFKKHQFFVSILLIIALTACGEDNSANQKNNNDVENATIRLATGNTSSAIYALGGGYSQAIENNLEDSDVTVLGTAGFGENAALLSTKEADIGTTNRVSAEYTLKDQMELVDELRIIATGHQNQQHIVVASGKGIKNVEDLKGKKVSVGEPGSATELISKSLLQAYDLTYDDIKPEYISFSESVDALQDNKIDAMLITTLLPNPGVMSLATQEDIEFLDMDSKHIEKLSENSGQNFMESVIPAGTYEGQEEDVITGSVPSTYVVHKDMSDELAYELTKIFVENANEVEKVHPAASQWTEENAILGVDFPYHPGAAKYYKDIDIWDDRVDGASDS